VESGKPCPEKNSQNRRQTVLFSIFSFTSRGELPSRARAPLPPRPYMALRARTPHSFLAGLQPTTGVSPETPTLVWDSSGPNHGEGGGGRGAREVPDPATSRLLADKSREISSTSFQLVAHLIVSNIFRLLCKHQTFRISLFIFVYVARINVNTEYIYLIIGCWHMYTDIFSYKMLLFNIFSPPPHLFLVLSLSLSIYLSLT
jgi:hypothetical protein